MMSADDDELKRARDGATREPAVGALAPSDWDGDAVRELVGEMEVRKPGKIVVQPDARNGERDNDPYNPQFSGREPSRFEGVPSLEAIPQNLVDNNTSDEVVSELETDAGHASDPLHTLDGSEQHAADSSVDPMTGDMTVAGGASRNKASGWFLTHSDGIVRGWCFDRKQPLERQQVAIIVDGVLLGAVVADRLHAQLRDQDEYSDGLCAFAYALPAAYRDGAEHSIAVEIITPGYDRIRLKTRFQTFTLSAESSAPIVTLKWLEDGHVEGTIEGTALKEELDLWVDGTRLVSSDCHVDWMRGPGQTLLFSLHVPSLNAMTLLTKDARISYPGVQEAGDGTARISDLLAIELDAVGDNHYRVTFAQGVHLADTILDAEIVAAQASASPLVSFQLAVQDNVAEFSLEGVENNGLTKLQLRLPDGAPLGSAIAFHFSQLPRRMLRNGSLDRWTESGPESFQVGDRVIFERSFYAFPAEIKAQHALSGNTLTVELEAQSDETIILSQSLPRTEFFGIEPVEVGLGLFARGSRPVLLTIRLTDGTWTLNLFQGALGHRWRNVRRMIDLTRRVDAPSPLRFELLARPLATDDEPSFVDLAGLHVGQPSIGTFSDEPEAREKREWSEPNRNLVVNSSLSSWPNGLSFTQRRSRFELAEGWTYFNRRSSSEVAVAASPAPTRQAGNYALSIGIAAVPEYCRIEIALDCEDLFGRGQLWLHARCADLPTPAGEVFAPQPWGFIDSIYLLRRDTREQDGRLVAKDTVLSKVARRVIVTRGWEESRFNFVVDQFAGGEFDIAQDDDLARDDDQLVEHYAVLEFRRPIALDLHGVGVQLGRQNGIVEDPLHQMEDRNIRAQAIALRGIEEWGSSHIIRPVVVPRLGNDSPDISRWNWKHAAAGTVEVAICVYNAADETIACLSSLVGTTSVPHTVRIIDDASEEDTHQRIAAFVRDKPWMTLTNNDQNQGYTRSANRAVMDSDADWVILLNSDTVVSSGWIEGLLEAASTDPRTALVGAVSNAATYQSVPELYDGAGKWAVNELPQGKTAADLANLIAARSNRHFPAVPLLNGFCTLIKRAIFVEVGGLNEQAFPTGYGEENDMCLRVRKAGYILRVADHVYVYHSKSASFGGARRTELAKAGDKALRALHQDVDFAALGRDFLETPALVELRHSVQGIYKQIELVPSRLVQGVSG